MSSPSFVALVEEKSILENQLNQVRYFLNGSGAISMHIDDVMLGQSITCQRSKIHEIAAGLIKPASSCVDIGPGLRPQRLLQVRTHLLVEPHQPYAQKLIATYPNKPVIGMDGLSFLKTLPDKSIDTVFLLDVIEHLEKRLGEELAFEARRVARSQVVVFTPLGFMPHHYSEVPAEWGEIPHNELQNHLSGWLPDEFKNSISVICNDYHGGIDKTYGAFYSIMDCSSDPSPGRLVLISEDCPNFNFKKNDILIADVCYCENSWLINSVPKNNLIIVPLQIIAESSEKPIEILRSTVINFELLEHYLKLLPEVMAIGLSAEVVLANLQPGC